MFIIIFKVALEIHFHVLSPEHVYINCIHKMHNYDESISI